MSLSPAQIKSAVEAFDTDGDGSVSLDEFIAMMESQAVAKAQPSFEEELRQVFAMFDKDGDGQITAAGAATRRRMTAIPPPGGCRSTLRTAWMR